MTILHRLRRTSHVAGIPEEAQAVLRRAYLLLEQVPQHPMRRWLLHGFGFVLSLRADYEEPLEVANKAETLSSTLHDPVLLIAACMVHGNVDQLQGRSQTARAWIERGLALLETPDAAPGETFLADPRASAKRRASIKLEPTCSLHVDRSS